jgi:hypothetical protein
MPPDGPIDAGHQRASWNMVFAPSLTEGPSEIIMTEAPGAKRRSDRTVPAPKHGHGIRWSPGADRP